jgi:DnaJ-class molecular chaperone
MKRIKISKGELRRKIHFNLQLTSHEERWLAEQALGKIETHPKRCLLCNTTGKVVVSGAPNLEVKKCPQCKGSGYLVAEPVEYEVTE